jgi:hypothetical protein
MTGGRYGDQHDAVLAEASIPHERFESRAHAGEIILFIE